MGVGMSRDVEPELLQKLGMIVTRWSFVEQCCSDLFVILTGGLPGTMPIVYANVSNRSIVEWTRTLMDIRYESEDWEIDKMAREILQDVDEIRKERNALVHGLWGTDKSPPGTAMVQTVRLERKEIILDELVTSTDLDALINDILDVCTRFVRLLKLARGEA